MSQTVGEKRPGDSVEPEPKKVHIASEENVSEPPRDHFAKGMAPIKPEFIIDHTKIENFNDDAAENSKEVEPESNAKSKRGKKNRGQNKKRDLKQQKAEVTLCLSLVDPENKRECRFGPDKCRDLHSLEDFIKQKPADNEGVCPVFKAIGYCPAGFKCRWLSSHLNKETNTLVRDLEKMDEAKTNNYEINYILNDAKRLLSRKQYVFEKADPFINYLDEQKKISLSLNGGEALEVKEDTTKQDQVKENQSTYIEAPFKASEKKRLDLRGAKIVSPLTTVGNLPYRRLMKTLGADVTYSEMALTQPLLQATNSEWALPKAHSSEYPGFGIQIATNQYWSSTKVAEIISKEYKNVSELNLNCGCPIDLLYKNGQGSALMDQPTKLVRILKGMNACSGDIPVTLKIRTGTKDKHNTAKSLVNKVLSEGDTAAITLHGRSRQQRYTREADWEYIGEIGKVVSEWNDKKEDDKERSDTQRTNFVGNGDVFTYEDWYKGVETEGIDSVMVARGALIKPWIFEEVESKQYIDKSATERLEILRTYSNFALEHWGSDQYGVQVARRFLLEFISFTHRYIPVGILERLPPKLNQRPPHWKGRNELETLLASTDYKDWIKITEMFLGAAGPDFHYTPKHKSNSTE